MKRLYAIAIGLALLGIQTQALTYISGTPQENGRIRSVLRYELPMFLSNLSNYHNITYQIQTENPSINIQSRVTAITLGESETSTWNSGNGQFGLRDSSEQFLKTGYKAIEIETVTIQDIRTIPFYLGIFIDSQIIGGWQLDDTYWAPKKDQGKPIQSRFLIVMADVSAPTVEAISCDDKEIHSGDYIEQKPKISAKIHDDDPGIKAWKIAVWDEKTQARIEEKSVTENSVSTQSVDIGFTPSSPLSQGEYRMVVWAKDAEGHTKTVTSDVVIVSLEKGIKNLIVGPTPYNTAKGTFRIEYQLTQPADVNVYILAIDGERQWESHRSQGEEGGTIGFNRIEWDGQNRFGETPANGMYVVYVEAKGDGWKSRAKAKCVVLK